MINNAGVSQSQRLMDSTQADYELVMDVSVRGSFNMSRAVVPHMLAAGYGRIVNVAARPALEEAHAEILFQRAQVLAQCRLGDQQRAGGAVGHDGEELEEQRQVVLEEVRLDQVEAIAEH